MIDDESASWVYKHSEAKQSKKIKNWIGESTNRLNRVRKGKTLSSSLRKMEASEPSGSFLPEGDLQSRLANDRKEYSHAIREKLEENGAEVHCDALRRFMERSSKLHEQDVFTDEPIEEVKDLTVYGPLFKGQSPPTEADIQRLASEKFARVPNPEMREFLKECHAQSIRVLWKERREKAIEDLQKIKMESYLLSLTKYNKVKESAQTFISPRHRTKPLIQIRSNSQSSLTKEAYKQLQLSERKKSSPTFIIKTPRGKLEQIEVQELEKNEKTVELSTSRNRTKALLRIPQVLDYKPQVSTTIPVSNNSLTALLSSTPRRVYNKNNYLSPSSLRTLKYKIDLQRYQKGAGNF
jgi:hypothetical protein